MTPTVEIRRVSEHVAQEVTLEGWLYNLRESGKLLFPLFRDGTGIIQGVVVKSAVPPEIFDRVRGLTQESSLRVTGKVRADQRAPGGYELDVSNVEVLQLIPENHFYSLEELFLRLIEKEQLLAFEVKERFYEIGSPQGLKDFEAFIQRRLKK